MCCVESHSYLNSKKTPRSHIAFDREENGPSYHPTMATINAERFYQRLERLQQAWLAQKSTSWAGADCLCILFSNSNDNIYSKPAAFHLYLFGYEDFTDSIIVFTRGGFYFFSSTKKCAVLRGELEGKGEGFTLTFTDKSKDEAVNAENFAKLIGSLKRNGVKSFGTLSKEKPEGSFLSRFMQSLDETEGIEKVDITAALGHFFSIKDEVELDFCKRAAIFSNKVMKHGFVAEMESILDEDKKITHQDLAKKVCNCHRHIFFNFLRFL